MDANSLIIIVASVFTVMAITIKLQRDEITRKREKSVDNQFKILNEKIDLMAKEKGLTKREIEILSEVMEGKTSREIGEELFIAEGTVKRHRDNLMKKIGAKNLMEVIKILVK